MTHTSTRVPWSRHLLIFALRSEDQPSEDRLATRLRTGIYWHPATDVLTSAVAAPARGHLSAAARAIGNLERDGLVTVKRVGRSIKSYRLTPKGRARAVELVEHDGRSSKTVRREKKRTAAQEWKMRLRQPGGRVYWEWRKELEFRLFSPLSPLYEQVMAWLFAQLEEEHVGTWFDEDGLPDSHPDPVVRYVATAWEYASMVSASRTLSKRRKLIEHNDEVWPEYRARLINSGHPIKPNASWRDLRDPDYFDKPDSPLKRLTAQRFNSSAEEETVEGNDANAVQD